nr:MAG TPA: hypothetical protein [Caudoviricetes sp.]
MPGLSFSIDFLSNHQSSSITCNNTDYYLLIVLSNQMPLLYLP